MRLFLAAQGLDSMAIGVAGVAPPSRRKPARWFSPRR
jgi:hypothetical protein